MAAHCCGDDVFAAPLERDSDLGTEPAPSVAPIPEAVPLPKAKPAKEPTKADKIEPFPSRAKLASPSAAVPEAIPLPKAQPATEPMLPGLGEPPPSQPLPKKEVEQGQPPVPPPDMPPTPIRKMDFLEPNDSPIWR